MKQLIPILVRTLAVFAVFCGLQYLIPYYLLAIGGIAAGFFMIKTGEDKALSYGILIGSIAFAVFAYTMAQIYPTGGG